MIRSYLLWLYIFFNVSCAVYFGLIDKLGGDFKYEYPSDASMLIFSCVIVVSSFVLVQGVIFKFYERMKIRKHCSFNNSYKLDFLMLVLVILAILSSIFFKVGVLGVNKDVTDDAPKIVFYFNTFFQPVLLVLIYLFYRCDSNRVIYFLIYLLYATLVVLNGQTAQLLLLFCLYLLRKSRQGKKYNFYSVLALTGVGVGLYPFVRMMKDTIVHSANSGGGIVDSLGDLISRANFETYFDYLFITLERFQMISNTHFVIDNGEQLGTLFSKTGSSYSFYSLHWLVSSFIRFFDIDSSNILSAQDFLAYQINGVSTWSSQIGIVGYFIFYHFYSIIIIFSMLIILFLSVRLSAILSQKNELVDLTWCMSLLLICHGWFIPFINYFQSVFIFMLLIFILNIGTSIHLNRNKNRSGRV